MGNSEGSPTIEQHSKTDLNTKVEAHTTYNKPVIAVVKGNNNKIYNGAKIDVHQNSNTKLQTDSKVDSKGGSPSFFKPI